MLGVRCGMERVRSRFENRFCKLGWSYSPGGLLYECLLLKELKRALADECLVRIAECLLDSKLSAWRIEF